jgi:GNAT superfamily N-acetyltransferase
VTVIRTARPEDLMGLQEIERIAGTAFRDLGMAEVANDDPPAMVDLSRFQRDGRAWVTTDPADHPIGYLLLDIVDSCAHVEQVSIHPRHAHHRLGSALLDTATTWARDHGLAAVTLTTYAEVAWNAPYYQRLGFTPLTDQQLGPELRRILDHEAARGLAGWPRVAMSRPILPAAN